MLNLSLLLILLPPHQLSSLTIDAKGAGELHIVVSGIKIEEGQLGILLFDQAEGFPSDAENAIYQKTVQVEGKEISVALGKFPFGQYALAVVHDINGNQQMDRNLLRIPKEPFAFSSLEKIGFGPPSFQEASFRLKQRKETLNLKLIELF